VSKVPLPPSRCTVIHQPLAWRERGHTSSVVTRIDRHMRYSRGRLKLVRCSEFDRVTVDSDQMTSSNRWLLIQCSTVQCSAEVALHRDTSVRW
jgi:hypothetical protein